MAILIRSLPDRWENSTAKTVPVEPTISATCDTEVPLAAPRYRTLAPGRTNISSRPPNIPAANFDLNGFHTRYSVLVAGGGASPLVRADVLFAELDSTAIRFSP